MSLPEMKREMLMDRIDDLSKRHSQAINAFAKTNLNLNLCKTFLQKLVQSDLTSKECKREIRTFLQTLNDEK